MITTVDRTTAVDCVPRPSQREHNVFIAAANGEATAEIACEYLHRAID